MKEPVKLYTDGSSLGNPGPGGIGVVLKYKDKQKEISRGYYNTTNNRMELRAVIEGLKAIKNPEHPVQVWTDSQYVANAFNKGWIYNWEKKDYKNRKNADLWKQLLQLWRKLDVQIGWVKGHAGHAENERCDTLAVNAAKNPTEEDTGY